MIHDSILTVLTAASTHDLLALATTKDEPGITDTAPDTSLARRITDASAQIMNYTHRVFAVETVAELWRFQLYRAHRPSIRGSVRSNRPANCCL